MYPCMTQMVKKSQILNSVSCILTSIFIGNNQHIDMSDNIDEDVDMENKSVSITMLNVHI